MIKLTCQPPPLPLWQYRKCTLSSHLRCRVVLHCYEHGRFQEAAEVIGADPAMQAVRTLQPIRKRRLLLCFPISSLQACRPGGHLVGYKVTSLLPSSSQLRTLKLMLRESRCLHFSVQHLRSLQLLHFPSVLTLRSLGRQALASLAQAGKGTESFLVVHLGQRDAL